MNVETELAISRRTFAVLWSSGTWRSPSISDSAMVTNPSIRRAPGGSASQFINLLKNLRKYGSSEVKVQGRLLCLSSGLI